MQDVRVNGASQPVKLPHRKVVLRKQLYKSAIRIDYIEEPVGENIEQSDCALFLVWESPTNIEK
jgi:hypothetical protein